VVALNSILPSSVVFLVTATVALAAGPLEERWIEKRVSEGIRLYREGKLDESLKAFTDAQTKNWESPEIKLDEATVLARKKDVQKARDLLQKVVETAPAPLKAQAYYTLGCLDLDGQNYQGAQDNFRNTLKIAPTDRDAKHNLELALALMKKEKNKPSPSPSPNPSPNPSPKPSSNPSPNPSPDPSPKPSPGASPSPNPSPNPSPGQSASPAAQPSPAGSPSPDGKEMNEQAARRLLDSMNDDEKKNLKELLLERLKKEGERPVEKDW